jgi:transcriptional regulator with XRE-family HTH domain
MVQDATGSQGCGHRRLDARARGGGEPVKTACNLRALRLAAGLSQSGLARSAGLTSAAICYIEGGRSAPSAETLCKLADALGVSTDALLGRGDEHSWEDASLSAAMKYLSDDDRLRVAEYAMLLANAKAVVSG